MSFYPRYWLKRVLAFFVDWLVIALWGGLLFGAVMLMSGGVPVRPAHPWTAQALGFVAMTLPVILYFGVLESSPRQASLGKRAARLRVVAATGGSLDLKTSLLRNALKFLPWEIGHLVAQQAVHSGDAGLPAWWYVPAAFSFLLPIWWMGAILRSRVAPYDRWSGARVVMAREEPGGRNSVTAEAPGGPRRSAASPTRPDPLKPYEAAGLSGESGARGLHRAAGLALSMRHDIAHPSLTFLLILKILKV